ncbi:MAG: hypothetical protein EOO01_41710, partial [Chitinophagaceae bacterium]
MSKTRTFREFFKKYGYLLILSAWCVTVAIIVDRYWAPESSLSIVEKNVAVAVKDAELDFVKLVKDTSFLRQASATNQDRKFIDEYIAKKYFLFTYKDDGRGEKSLVLWNTQKVLPTSSLLYLKGKSGFALLQNGYYV